jgi:hypothetical protein
MATKLIRYESPEDLEKLLENIRAADALNLSFDAHSRGEWRRDATGKETSRPVYEFTLRVE